MSEAASPTAASAEINLDTTTIGRDFFLNIAMLGMQPGIPAPGPIGLSPHSHGPAVRAAREALGLSRAELVERSGEAFDEAWLDAAETGARVDARQLAILAARLEVQTSDLTLQVDPRPPYRGLLAFEPEDAALFGGREGATAEILAILDRHPIVALIGASGSGKSSVVKAGVVPSLSARQDPPWRGLILRPGADPLLALARALGSELDRGADEDTRLGKARRRAGVLAGSRVPLSDYLDRIAELRAEAGVAPRLLLFVDQWEELYTQTLDAVRRAIFIDHLIAAFEGGPHRLILTMRADFTGRILEDRRSFFDAAKPGMLPLPRMSRTELARAIRKPAEAVGYAVEDALVETILKDAGEEPGGLALVEFTLTELWKKRDEAGRQLTLSAYAAMGGLNEAIDRHAEAVYDRLSPEQQSAARRALTRLVHVSTLETYTRQRRPLSAFDETSRQVLHDLAGEDTRLVVISQGEDAKDRGSRTEAEAQDAVEVAHEAVIREWKRLHEWVSADPAFLQWREGVERRLQRYDEKGRRDEDLLQGSDLEDAQSWSRTRGALPESELATPLSEMAGETASAAARPASLVPDPEIPTAVRTFIATSLARRATLEAERKAAEAERRQAAIDREIAARKHAEHQAEASRRLTGLGVTAALVLLVAALGLAFVAYWGNSQRKIALHNAGEAINQNRIAEARTIEARSNQAAALSALSHVALQTDPTRATKLALAAWPRRSEGDLTPKLSVALAALGEAVGELRERKDLRGHTNKISDAVFSPDGSRVVTASWDHTGRVWDTTTGRSGAVLEGHTDLLTSAAFSRDGRRIVTASQDNTARVWESDTGKNLVVLKGHTGRVEKATFSPNGDRILTASNDGTAHIWNASTGKSLITLNDANIISVDSAEYSPDGLRVVTIAGAATVWNADTGQKLFNLRADAGALRDAAFTTDSRRIVASSDGNTAIVWDAITGQKLLTLKGSPSWVSKPVFSSNGGFIAAISGDNTARVWSAVTGESLAVLEGHSSYITSVVFSPDSRRVVTASNDNTARVWDVTSNLCIAILKGHTGAVSTAVVSADNRRILTASADTTARIWDTAVDRSLILKDDWGTPEKLAFSQDGRRIATSSDNQTVRLWDIANGQINSVIDTNTDLAFSRISGRFAGGSGGDTVRIWDMSTGQFRVLRNRSESVKVVLFSPDGSRILTTSSDGMAQIWDVAAGKIIATLNGAGSVLTAAFSPDNFRVVTISDGKIANVWDGTSGNRLVALDGQVSWEMAPLFSPGGDRIVSASGDSTSFLLWDAMTGRPLITRKDPETSEENFRFAPPTPPPLWDGAAEFSHDGRLLLLTHFLGGKLQLLVAASGQNLVEFEDRVGSVTSAAFSPDSRRLVTTSDDEAARVWDTTNGQVTAFLQGHAGRVTSASFSPDSQRLVASSDNKSARVWDIATGKNLAIYKGHQSEVTRAEFSPNGHHIVTFSDDHTIRVWNPDSIPAGTLFQVACGWLVDYDLSGLANEYGLTKLDPICKDQPGFP